MAERVLGLDVGTSAVRVVEVAFERPGGRRPGRSQVVTRVGEVPLPDGAVRDGEVADPAAVGAAIAELWRQTGLRSRDVRVGLTGARVVVRVIDMPAMPDEDLAGAVRFSAADHIPIPIEDAVIDQAVLEPGPPAEPGGPDMVKVLVAAAHRSTLDGLLAAVAAGGLRAVAVDLVPFALVRALYEAPAEEATERGDAETGEDGFTPPPRPAAEAIVSVGAALTTVVVHEAGRPRFVRTVQAGGEMLTAAVADELGLDATAAESAKRDAGPFAVAPDSAGDDLTRRAARVVELRLAGILSEIQNSLAYWMAQADRPLRRIVLTGGGARAGDIAGRLSLLVGAPVEYGVLHGLEAPEPAAGAGDWADHMVAAGVALGAGADGWQIDLCPPVKRSLGITGELGRRVAVAAAVVAVLVVGMSARSVLALRQERSQLAAQKKATAKVESEIGQYSDLRKLSTDLDTGRKRVQSALATDVSWTRFLDDFVRHMPPGAWIGSLNAQINASVAGAAKGSASSPAKNSPVGAAKNAASGTAKDAAAKDAASDSGGASSAGAAKSKTASPTAGIGSVQWAVTGLDFPDAADWLRKVTANPSLSGVTIGGVTKSGEGGSATVAFTSSANVTSAARSDRAARLAKAAL